jgi:hypothetical protein
MIPAIVHTAIADALRLLPDEMDSSQALVMLFVIGLQESRFETRRQYGGGPGRDWWQFEEGGAVHGVLAHEDSREPAIKVCDARSVTPTTTDVYNMLEHDDVLAAAFARLLLWTDPHPLPKFGEVGIAWDYYLRNWRPGAYTNGTEAKRAELRARWNRNYALALTEVTGDFHVGNPV